MARRRGGRRRIVAKRRKITELAVPRVEYDGLVGDISALLEQSRRTTARAINNVLTATYWEIGRRIVEFEQGGEARAEYGTELLKRLATDLTARFGRGFSRPGLQRMRAFFQGWEICSTLSSKFEARVKLPAGLLDSVDEKVPAGSGTLPILQAPSAKSPIPLIQHLEAFLLELGAGFSFVARQKRIRIGTEWYRIDLLLFHRRLRCLVVIDLKIGKFSHSDAGQMSLYLTYAKEHLTELGEHEPVGIILCSDKDDAVVHYSMGHMPAKVFASRYLTDLPDPETLRREILETKHALEARVAERGRSHE